MQAQQPASVASAPSAAAGVPLVTLIRQEVHAHGGWLGFERFMELALYAPRLGYYARGDRQFGALPASGSDFITAPELSPLFGRALARQVSQSLAATQTREVWEFGAGSGALAAQLLQTLGDAVDRYTIVDLSGTLRERQRATVAAHAPAAAHKLRFADAWPAALDGVVVANELLDAMPVLLLAYDGSAWHERGVVVEDVDGDARFAWADRPTPLRPPVPADSLDAWPPGSVIELPRQASGFVRSLAAVLRRGAAFFIDYGFPAHEFYHPQRHAGTLMCHRAHRADADPLSGVGDKDITAHVDFTAIALVGQDAGLAVLGYTSQARFLLNCGLADDLAAAQSAGDVRALAAAHKLLAEHEMGELFKVLGFAAAATPFDAIGFAEGDRTHTL